MNRLLARSAVALAAAPLILLAVQGSPGGVSASGKAPSASAVAQAHAQFVKVMSSHAPVVGRGGWVSPGAQHRGAPRATKGTVNFFPSLNWSGYADSESGSNTVSYVSGDWTLPAVQCLPAPYQNQDAFLANWVGIDGFTNQTVEQLGTVAQCYEGVTYYYVWYELYPAGTVEEGAAACINGNTDCPEPGDQISASVSVKPTGDGVNNSYTLTLVDQTRPDESFSTTQTCAIATCADASAEWIVERPAFSLPSGVQILPLADFTTTAFSSADVVSGGRPSSIGDFQDGPIYDIPMIDDSLSYYLACVGQPNPPGTLLTVSQTNACPTVAPLPGGAFQESWDSSF